MSIATSKTGAANDVLSANVNFEEWSAARAAGLDAKINKFEYYCVDQFLKSYPIADEDILAGMTGGPGDGGVDAIFFFANRKIVTDETQISSETTLRVNLEIFQVKENRGFSPTEINKLYFFRDDLLNLTIPAATFKEKYNARLLDIMDTFKTKFPKVGVPKRTSHLFTNNRYQGENEEAAPWFHTDSIVTAENHAAPSMPQARRATECDQLPELRPR